MEDEALQRAEVRPAELVDNRIHPSDHLPLVWLTWKENEHTPLNQVTFHLLKLTLSWRTDKQQEADYELTHGPEELLV